MVRNNKGLSLVELIIAIAILAIAGITIFGFVSNTSNAYSRASKDIKLQYEQQMAVNQIRDMVVESDRGVYFDSASKSLALYGAEKTDPSGAKVYPVTVVRFKQTEGEIYFGTKDFATPGDVTFVDVPTNKLLSDDVKEFKVDLTGVKKDKVSFEVTFIVGEREQTVRETVALRNRLVVSNDVDTIWGGDPGVVESFIQGVTISRGAKTFTNGERDTIGKHGENVSVEYKATVTANAESTRNYGVSWNLKNALPGVAITVGEGGLVTVTVSESAENSGVVELHATCLDDATKTAYIEIQITNYGVYPKEVRLENGGEQDGNGYRIYTLVPTVVYTDTTEKSDLNLVTWDAPDELPSGCSFDGATGKIVLSHEANGKEITIRAKAKERSATNAVLTAEITLKPTDIPKYVIGPSVSIAVASTVSRGSYVFPTMVFKDAPSSSFTYKWKVEPYHDTASTQWDTGEVSNSEFKLISISEEGGYDEWNVKHEMETSVNRRTIALNCAEWLNWNRTFKVKISGTATDKDGKEYVAPEKIVTINPVEITIEKTDVSNIDPELWRWDDNKPVLTDSVLRYEDWYWYGLIKGSEDAKWKGTRRWFNINCKNVYLTGTNSMGCTLTHNYIFRNQIGNLISNDTPYLLPNSRYAETMMLCGFMKEDMIRWEQLATKPVYMNYSITMKDGKGNSKESNVENFTIEYKFYEPKEK